MASLCCQLVVVTSLALLFSSSHGFSPIVPCSNFQPIINIEKKRNPYFIKSLSSRNEEKWLSSGSTSDDLLSNPTRRSFFSKSTLIINTMSMLMTFISHNDAAVAVSEPEIISKIFLQFKGLPSSDDGSYQDDKIIIGLYDKISPQPINILKQLVSSKGYPAKCKPRDETRVLQREQLEANKVYNSCIESQDTYGVTYDLSTVWRVIKDERIDLGAVSGRFISRESPVFEMQASTAALRHDREGVVSVRKGSDGGFGFTIYPGVDVSGQEGGQSTSQLDEENIIVGQVLEGMDVVRKLNELPVVRSAGAIGGSSQRSAPSRACRYGSSEYYCNEFKPLKKISISNTGLVAN